MITENKPTSKLLLAVALVLATCIAYIPAMQAGYIWDDDAHITENRLLDNPEGLKRFWVDPQSVPSRQVYPLTFTTFWIEHQLWGKNPMGYHVVNIILHCLNGLLLWHILSRWKVPGAWLAACVFLLHPINVESVAWITERKNVLSAFFYLSALVAFQNFKEDNRKRWYACSILLYFFALTAKTTACSLPVALWIVAWWRNGNLIKKDFIQSLPYFAIGIPLGVLTVWFERHHVGAWGQLWDFSLWDRLLIASRAFWFYQWKILWPLELSFVYPRWEINPSVWWQWLFVVSGLALPAILWIFRKKTGRGVLAGILFFLVTIFPALGFFNIYPMRFSFVADHFQYLAGIGSIVIVVGLIEYGFRYMDLSRFYSIFILVFMIIMGALTWQTGGKYKNLQSLWEDTLDKNPNVYIAHNDLGVIYFNNGEIDRAISSFKEAIKLCPYYDDAHYNLGVAYGSKGMLRESYQEMNLAMNLRGRSAKCE